MNRIVVLVLAIAAGCGVVWASEPGEPLDCSDWVFNEPGLSCSVYAPPGDPDLWASFRTQGSNKEVDNEGNLIALRVVFPSGTSPHWDIALARTELVRYSNGVATVLAYVEDRDAPDNGRDHYRPTNALCRTDSSCQGAKYTEDNTINIISFDPTNGRVLIPCRSTCTLTTSFGCPVADYNEGWKILAIDGFATLFEILQTYQPPTSAIGFRVPYMPEGFQYADYFDTYAGTLASVGDWSSAQPLRCGYPASHPSVGDYVTVEDTLPTPDPGQGYYYVTAATYQGETRYGRKASGGQLSGRDPAVLPQCSE